MTDRELLELIAAQVGALTTQVDKVNEQVGTLTKDMQEVKEDIKDLKTDIKDLKDGQEKIANKLDDIEANNADRHITIHGEIKRIKSVLSKLEIVTADNWSDIARLKAYRKNKIK